MAFSKILFKNIYKVHTYAGIFVAVHFAIFAVSGLILLFKDEIQNEPVVESPHTPSAAEKAANYQVILQGISREYPKDRPLALYPDDHNANLIHARSGIDGATELRGARRLSFYLDSGKPVTEKESKASGFFDWVLQLHRDFLLGSNGKLYLGFVGFMYVFMLLSGFFIYGKFMKGRSFGEIRQASVPRWVDLHKFIGVITFGWGLIVGLSGVFLAFNGVLIKFFQMQSLQHLSQKYQSFKPAASEMAPFDQVIENVFRTKIDSVISYISFPHTEYGISGHYLILVNGTTALTQKISELFVMDAYTAKLAEIIELPLYLKVVLLSEPLHFGDYGGLPLKVIWALFTLGSMAVAGFGVASFFMKRKNRKMAGAKDALVLATPQPTPPMIQKGYPMPVGLAVISILGILAALFLGSAWATLLLIPLFFLIFGRRGKNV